MSLATLSPGRTWGFYLGGNWITDRDSEPVLSPFDQSVIAAVPNATPADLERAITAAVSAFELTRKMSSYERQQILRKISAAITARREELAQTMSREAGKPIKAARVEVDRAAFTFDLAAEESTRLTGEWLPLDQQPASRGRYGILRRFAIGPIAAITPFNFPLNLVAHKVAPAIACGCTVVLKPAPQTPFSALLLAELIHRAGWPEGALSILPMSNETAAPLITDDRL